MKAEKPPKEVRRQWFYIAVDGYLMWRNLLSTWDRKEVLAYLKKKGVYKSGLKKGGLLHLY